MGRGRTGIWKKCSVAWLIGLVGFGTALVGLAPPSGAAAVTTVTGGACGYSSNVGLFGGARSVRGCGQATADEASASPKVKLPLAGATKKVAAAKAAGATAMYGPAAVLAGRWPVGAASAPPTGPLSVSTQGTPAGGKVTSSAAIVRRTPSDPLSPGGFGPGPVQGDELHSTCSASGAAAKGGATFVNGLVTLATDPAGMPLTQEAIPDKPPANYTRSGAISTVGDRFTAVFNEHVVNPDGSLTVNAVHMYLQGPTAVGELVEGQVTCGTSPHPALPADKTPPSCGLPGVVPVSPQDPTPKAPRTEFVAVQDTGGIGAVTNVQATNATVQVGTPGAAQDYLTFKPGQTGPLAVTATVTDASQPMTWSFDVTDSAGNVTHSSQCPTDSPLPAGISTVTVDPAATADPAPGFRAAALASPAALDPSLVGAPVVAAATTAVKGTACGYITNVGLFGGPQQLRGCGQPPSGPAEGTSPSVSLPAGGSASPVTASKPEGAKATYGPAAIFAGIWPANVSGPPPSGPISVSTEGAPGGAVKSSADIKLRDTPLDVPCASGFNPPCTAPGGFGPGPFEGDTLHSECAASDTDVSGAVSFTNGKLTLTEDAGGAPLTQEPIPDSPPVNYTRSSIITNVGDLFTVVFNQQVHNADGTLTVTAVHAYLFGPTAVGELIEGQVTCGTDPHPAVPADTQGPSCSIKDVEPNGPDDPTPKDPRTELIGVFDAQGLQAINNIQSDNATVQVGNPDSGQDYLKFTPGQTGPLPITATITDGSKPMTWSFDAVDTAGNVTHSSQCPTDSPPAGNATTVTTVPGDNPAGGAADNAGGDATGTDSTGASMATTGKNIAMTVLVATGLIVVGAFLELPTRRRRRSGIRRR